MKQIILIFLAFFSPAIALAQFSVVQGGTGTSSVPANYVLLGSTTLHMYAVSTSSLGLPLVSGISTSSLAASWPILLTANSSNATYSWGGLATTSPWLNGFVTYVSNTSASPGNKYIFDCADVSASGGNSGGFCTGNSFYDAVGHFNSWFLTPASVTWITNGSTYYFSAVVVGSVTLRIDGDGGTNSLSLTTGTYIDQPLTFNSGTYSELRLLVGVDAQIGNASNICLTDTIGGCSGGKQIAGIATSTPSIGSILTYTGILGNLVGGSSGTFGIAAGAVTNAMLANSTISGIALGSNLGSLSTNSTLSGTSYNGNLTLSDWGINLANSNQWTASTTFTKVVNLLNASSSLTTLGTTWFNGVTSSLLGTDQNGKVVATTSVGYNLITGGPTGANPTASVGSASATNGTATTFLRSDAVPACTIATASVPGCLAAADFTIFNGKQASLGYVPWGGTVTTTFNTTTIASTTPPWFKTGYYASSTVSTPSIDDFVIMQKSTTTSATTTTFGFTNLTDALLSTNHSGGVVATTSIGANFLTGILQAAQFPALTGDITTVAGALATTLKNTGTAGTYRSTTFDAQGRETSGTNPITFSGYAISDTSANLAAALTDETGTGFSVFSISPTFTGKITAAAASTTDVSVTNSFYDSNLTSALALFDANHKEGAFGGASSCAAHNFFTGLSSAGASTCGTDTISGVNLGGTLGALTATDGSLTFSGSYTGATARTVGISAIAANSVLGNVTSASAVPSAVATSSLFSGTTGQTGYFSGTGALVGTSTIFMTTGSQVGIGTVSPGTTLHVKRTDGIFEVGKFENSSAGGAQVVFTDNSTSVQFGVEGATAAIRTGGTQHLAVDSTGRLGISAFAAATANTVCYDTTTIGGFNTFATCSSLRALKKNIKPLDLFSDVFLRLQPVYFENKKTGAPQYGFIAEDVNAVDPILSSYYQGALNGVDYNGIVSLLTLTVQKQQKQIDALTKRLDALEK